MGIKHLNRFLRTNCKSSIKQINLGELYDKTIAVDASIYLYRFQSDRCLIEGTYQMIGLFRYYGIRPIFVFDGKPPPEKEDVRKKRREEKYIAEKKYNEAIKQLKESDPSDDTTDLEAEIDALRRKFVRINDNDIREVKKILQLMGIAYYEADTESDGICVRLVQRKIAYACLSEDMDMFAYGCPRVLRYLSLLRGTVVIYKLEGILKTLNITCKDFKRICILAGTDYNTGDNQHVDLNHAIKLYSKFSNDKKSNDFYKWIVLNYDNFDINSLEKCEKIFNSSKYSISRSLLTNTNYDKEGLHTYLRKYGFVFA